jgi:DNA modification methylase
MFTSNLIVERPTKKSVNARDVLRELLKMDLGFHGQDSSEMSHDIHAFPAKFPPQLPRVFITHLTLPGQRVLDPMMGSGTCVLEAVASGRTGVGFDIDPLAVMLTKVKVSSINPVNTLSIGYEIADRAAYALNNGAVESLERELSKRFDSKTREFIDYWFSRQTQIELISLLREIEKIKDRGIREFLLLAFSAIIITKSGGVSLAWDLAHTRPHKLNQGIPKSYRPALKEFRKRLEKNIGSLCEVKGRLGNAFVNFGNAEALPLKSDSIDLLFTSPPYASNAIDYMRAHKFSLVWFGKHIDTLSELRSKYIGGEKVATYQFLEMPPETFKIVSRIAKLDKKKGDALLRYYSEMQKVLAEAFRVLKPGKAAVFVVGTSTMRGVDSKTQNCLGEIGSMLGFDLAGIGVRKLDRDKRMMPARLQNKRKTQIEERMHEEYIVALMKPERGK